MKKTICKVEYDTEKAAVVKKFAVGNFGDPAGYEETLYQTEGGLYFLYVNGGEASVYPTEDIKRIAKNKVEAWLADHE
ncbi:MAG: hypothetical protein IKM53_00810 [Clostridia bacterium]|nr:hypothetical protein [Clostridia bacterium]